MSDPEQKFAEAVAGSDVAAPARESIGVRVNTHAVAYAGVAAGGLGLSGVTASVYALFHALADPEFLISLYGERARHEFGHAQATFDALLFGVAGSLLVAALAYAPTYFGRPQTIE